MLHAYSVHRLRQRAFTLGLLSLLPAVAAAQASTHLSVDPKSSLAWWQVNPNLNHLWATTCPQEPSWRPGEGRSSGWSITNYSLPLPKTGYTNASDTVHVPLYPRHRVRPLCQEAVQGELEVADTAHWRGVHGVVEVRADALVSGESMRDAMMHSLLNTGQFPDMQFTLDSLVGLTRQGDTLVARAMGTLLIRGIPKAATATVKAFPEAGGMRVLAKFRMPASALVEFAPRIGALSLGTHGIWQDFFFGVDLVLRPVEKTASR